jgi:hypothetical protein
MKFNQPTGPSEVEKKPGFDPNQKKPGQGQTAPGQKKPAQGGYHEGEKSR